MNGYERARAVAERIGLVLHEYGDCEQSVEIVTRELMAELGWTAEHHRPPTWATSEAEPREEPELEVWREDEPEVWTRYVFRLTDAGELWFAKEEQLAPDRPKVGYTNVSVAPVDVWAEAVAQAQQRVDAQARPRGPRRRGVDVIAEKGRRS